MWQFDGGAESVQIDCLGDQVLVGWLDAEADTAGTNFNDVVYNFSEDNGLSWLVGIRDSAENHTLAPFRFDSIAQATSFKENLDVRLLEDGRSFASWTDGRSGTRDIYFQQLTAGERPVVLLADEELE